MKAATVLGFLSTLALAAAQGLPIINTPPSLIQCQPAQITFSGGVAPYFLSVLPAGQVAAAPIAFLPDQPAAGSYTWVVNLAAGTNITLSIRDSQGQLNYAAPLVVQAGSDSSCVGVVVSGASSAPGTAQPTASVGSPSAGVSSVATSAAMSGTVINTGASATVTAASGTPTNTINGTSAMFNFTCPQGLLTYGITVAELEGVSISQAISYLRNWTASVTGVLVRSNGTGVGSQRTYTIGGNVSFIETLRLNTTNATSLHQQWNFTQAAPVQLTPQLTVYNAFDDLTVYRNETSNTTSIQYFILACFNDQATGLTTLASFINQGVTYWAGQITGASANSTAVPAKVRKMVRLA